MSPCRYMANDMITSLHFALSHQMSTHWSRRAGHYGCHFTAWLCDQHGFRKDSTELVRQTARFFSRISDQYWLHIEASSMLFWWGWWKLIYLLRGLNFYAPIVSDTYYIRSGYRNMQDTQALSDITVDEREYLRFWQSIHFRRFTGRISAFLTRLGYRFTLVEADGQPTGPDCDHTCACVGRPL